MSVSIVTERQEVKWQTVFKPIPQIVKTSACINGKSVYFRLSPTETTTLTCYPTPKKNMSFLPPVVWPYKLFCAKQVFSRYFYSRITTFSEKLKKHFFFMKQWRFYYFVNTNIFKAIIHDNFRWFTFLSFNKKGHLSGIFL